MKSPNKHINDEHQWIANQARPFPILKEDRMMLFMQKEYRRKNPSNWNDPKSASTRNQKDWPTGEPNGNYKLNLSYWYQPSHVKKDN